MGLIQHTTFFYEIVIVNSLNTVKWKNLSFPKEWEKIGPIGKMKEKSYTVEVGWNLGWRDTDKERNVRK